MKARDLLTRLSGLGIELWSEDGRLRYRSLPGVMTEALKSELREHKDELLELLSVSPDSIPKLADQTSYALSSAQRRMWILAKLEQGAAAYNIPLHQLLSGPLNVDTLAQAISQVVERHESLRTTFAMIADEPRQVVHQQVDDKLRQIDLSDKDDPLAAAEQLAREDARLTFDLERGPLFRAALVRLGNDRHVLLFTIHHIVCDGISIGVLAKEIANRYLALRQGDHSLLPRLAIQYRDYAAWEVEQLESGALSGHRDWWLESFSGKLPVLDLPTDMPRPALQSFEGRELSIHLDAEKLAALGRLGHQQNASLYMTLLSMVYVLLHKYTGQEEIVIGSPIAGRGHADLEDQIGLYINTIALRVGIDGEKSFPELLAQVRQTALQTFDHQAYPFDRLVDELQVQRDLSRNPLFDVTLILQSHDDSGLAFDEVDVEPLIEHSGTSKTDLTFGFNETASGLGVAIEYNTDLFNEDRIVRMLGHFEELVDSIVAAPDVSIDRLNILSRDEAEQLVRGLNDTSRPYPADKTVIDLFAERARRIPDAIAIQCEENEIAYAELNDRVNQLADHLKSLDVDAGALVGIFMDRGIDMVAAVLAVLKVGAAFVPLDPAFPRTRLELMLADSKASVIFTQQALLDEMPQSEARVTCVDADSLTQPPGASNPANESRADDLAYVIYTSGSTGRPKGVSVPHRALVNFLCSMADEPGLSEDDTVLAVTTLSFDIAALEIFLPLIKGAKLVLATREIAADGMRLLRTLDQSGATVMQATPATWRMLLAAGWEASPQLKALCGGEALPNWLADQLLERCASVWNMYGPTETTIWSTIAKLGSKDGQPQDAIASIGRPIANTEIYILDQNLQPVPIGVPGDLYIGGDGLATGYLHQPELTAEKFPPHPFRTGESSRIYKTGDSARYQADGNIQFLGRTDQQIKLRGFRIELGDIESTLESHSEVQQAVVDLRDHGGSDPQLVAWYRGPADRDFSSSELREYLRGKLPDYMIPAIAVRVSEFPLTPNGKVDRKALLLPDQVELSSAEYQSPRHPREAAIAEIWQEVLQVPRVGVHDDFFELGGHSLKATQVISRIHRELQVEIALREIFSKPTVAGLAEIVGGRKSSDLVKIPKAADAEHYELSHGQRRLWVLSQMEEGSAAYNLPAAIRLAGKVNESALQRALDTVVQRHEALRTSFVVVDGQPRAVVAPAIDVPIQKIDLSDAPDPAADARRIAFEDAATTFDLGSPGLIRMTLLTLAAEEHVLLFNIHHIIADQWSLDVLVAEFTRSYNDRGDLAPLPIQYRDYACWQNNYLLSDACRGHRDYWHRELDGELPVLNLPTDFPRPAIKTFHGKTYSRVLERGQTAQLEKFSRERGASLFMTLVAAVKTLLFRYTGQEDLIVGFPIAGRGHADLESQIGFYVNTLPLRSHLSGDLSFDELVSQVSKTCTEAYEHQVYPFDCLVDELELRRDVSRNPLFDVAVIMQHEQADGTSLDGLQASGFIDGYDGSKYDLHFSFDHHDGKLEMSIIYNTDLFRPERIERMSQHLGQLLDAALEDSSQPLGGLNVLAKDERQHLLGFNPGGKAFECPETLVEWFEARVVEQPDAIAVIVPESSGVGGPEGADSSRRPRQSLTYAELDSRANRLAHHLLELGVQANPMVGLCVEASLETVVSILAILKAGGAYVPLDTAHPVQRRQFVLEDAGVEILVTRRELADEISASISHVVCLDDDEEQISACAASNPPACAKRDDLAYVIYTSGSTGQPKGVPVTHHNVVRLFAATDQWFHFDDKDVWTMFHSAAFDFSVWEIWGALLHGGRLIVVPYWISRAPEAFYDLLIEEQVSVLSQTPSAFGQLIRVDGQREPLPELTLRYVVFGGEALDAPGLRPWFDRHGDQRPQLVNMYGITETTVHVTYRPIFAQDALGVTSRIGQAIPDLSVYLLDPYLNPVPIGVPGEICVGGPGVASGYLNRPELTAEKFVANPFSQDGGLLYRSGDLGCYREDGDIEYIGRLDQQVQIRGFRVETGEIAAALADQSAVAEAVVVTQEFDGSVRLIAYFVAASGSTPTVSELRRSLGEQLPGYMVPAVFMELEELPLTANKKLDRRALPEPDVQQPDERSNFVAPRTDLEHVIAGVFSDVLRVERVGAYDNFFDLGGDSLLATQIVASLRDTFRSEVSIVQLFTAQDVASLAEVLQTSAPNGQVDKIATAVRRLQNMTEEEKRQLASQRSS